MCLAQSLLASGLHFSNYLSASCASFARSAFFIYKNESHRNSVLINKNAVDAKFHSKISFISICDSTPRNRDSPLHILQRPRFLFLDKKSHLRQSSLSKPTAVQPCQSLLLKLAPLSLSHSIGDILSYYIHVCKYNLLK